MWVQERRDKKCVCERERVSERVCGRKREVTESMCVWESVWGRESVCKCVRVYVCERESVCARERECECVGERGER